MAEYLITTGLPELVDLHENKLYLSEGCLADKFSECLEGQNFEELNIVPSPWESGEEYKEAISYSFEIYEELMPQIKEQFNEIHETSYSEEYWCNTLGSWLLFFIGIIYDRYRRIQKAFQLCPDFKTYILPKEKCQNAAYDERDGIYSFLYNHYENLKLYSAAVRHICPNNGIEKDISHQATHSIFPPSLAERGKTALRKLFNGSSQGAILFQDMYHLNLWDMFSLKMKMGFKNISFVDSTAYNQSLMQDNYSLDLRERIQFTQKDDSFYSLLIQEIRNYLPMCFLENYKLYKEQLKQYKKHVSPSMIGSAVGWNSNQVFSFLAAEEKEKGAQLIDFQHGGAYGLAKAHTPENMSLLRDRFYTWGWRKQGCAAAQPLPSPHLSKLKNAYSQKTEDIVFVSVIVPKYQFRYHSQTFPEDMPRYYREKKIFFNRISDEVRKKILYRLYPGDAWQEQEYMRSVDPQIRFSTKGRLVSLMQKAKLVVVDNSQTSFLEALTISVPTICYWDHDAYLEREEATPYLDLLRDVGILHKDPVDAAQKVNEVYKDPLSWWSSSEVQEAKNAFCNQFAYACDDWKDIWISELDNLKRRNIGSEQRYEVVSNLKQEVVQ